MKKIAFPDARMYSNYFIPFSLMRQNIGIYWIPTTLRILPSCLNVMENEINLHLLNNLTSDNVLHAYMLILKCASNVGLMTSDKMTKVLKLFLFF